MSIMWDGKIAYAIDAFRTERNAWQMQDYGDGRRWIVHDMMRPVPFPGPNDPPSADKIAYTREVFASKDGAKDFIMHQAMAAAIKAHAE